MKKTSWMSVLLTVGLFAGTMVLGGCSRKVTINSLRKNPSPEVVGMARTRNNQLNEYARTNDTNRRQIVDDWDSIWLKDRPTRMSQYLVP